MPNQSIFPSDLKIFSDSSKQPLEAIVHSIELNTTNDNHTGFDNIEAIGAHWCTLIHISAHWSITLEYIGVHWSNSAPDCHFKVTSESAVLAGSGSPSAMPNSLSLR